MGVFLVLIPEAPDPARPQMLSEGQVLRAQVLPLIPLLTQRVEIQPPSVVEVIQEAPLRAPTMAGRLLVQIRLIRDLMIMEHSPILAPLRVLQMTVEI